MRSVSITAPHAVAIATRACTRISGEIVLRACTQIGASRSQLRSGHSGRATTGPTGAPASLVFGLAKVVRTSRDTNKKARKASGRRAPRARPAVI